MVQIALDFYRILGLPPQANLEQVHHAYRDRSLSLPRREYSDTAIAARRRIIDKAYEILSDPIYHQATDLELQSPELRSTESGSNSPQEAQLESQVQEPVEIPQTIEVSDRDLVGVLLLLHELGEYEQVIDINNSYSISKQIASTLQRLDSDRDIILTVALSHLEIGRDLWKQRKYDDAARELESSYEMLLSEGLFLSIRSEIQADLFKLRPYRILELLSTSEELSPTRKQGLTLLHEMLEERRGIDGTGNDYSGLDIDGFLRFIQQLRGYMTTTEQQAIFEDEARRPSAVASYLAVYALIAKGFSQKQPALIRRAKGLLVKLSGRQDIHLEQAVCALLLGQAEEASKTLEQSGEREKLDFIRDRSKGEPDLLPGLCLYCQTWLQEEVFPHFRDLHDRAANLKAYFADDLVQEYLEELSSANSAVGSEWTAAALPRRKLPLTSSNELVHQSYDSYLNASEQQTSDSLPETTTYSGRVPVLDRPASIEENNVVAEYLSPPAYREKSHTKHKERKKVVDRKPRSRPKPQISRVLILLFAAIAFLAGGASLLVWGWRYLISPAKQEASTKIEQPVAVLLDPKKLETNSVAALPGSLSQEAATKLVQAWQVAKSKALGSSHDIALLDNILTNPALSDWRSRAKSLKANNAYLQYIPKSLEIKKVVRKGDNKAIAIAQVGETRNYFSNGNLDPSSSKTDTSYEVEYVLVKVADKWLIADMVVAE
ncbi:IMS domain-containing protein [Pseudanabaena sp. PCC 6802]|uniref:IMS domain-containing protein n=1 Tax=Pseudanabaena sp. PCC 6802 TaxID=118173 RepID=UPI00034597F1|nr:IMS domain-containing protein [Pseudanabaena sp. PCC 6802]